MHHQASEAETLLHTIIQDQGCCRELQGVRAEGESDLFAQEHRHPKHHIFEAIV